MALSSDIRSTPGYSALLRNNDNFRSFWCSRLVSPHGNRFSFIASAARIAVPTGSGTAICAVSVIRFAGACASLTPAGAVSAGLIG